MFIDLHITEAEYIKTNLKGDDLNIFLDKFLSLKETQAFVDKIKIITSYEQAFSLLALTQSYDLINEFILDDQINLKN